MINHKKKGNQDLLKFYVFVIGTVFQSETSNNTKYAPLRTKEKSSKYRRTYLQNS